MKRLGIAVLGLAVLVSGAFATDAVVTGPAVAADGSEELTMPAEVIGWQGGWGELDEIVGDTVHVGTSPWDAQHNSKAARQIAFDQGADWQAHIIWAKLQGLEPADPRHTVYSRVTGDGQGGFEIDPEGLAVENWYRSGYTTMSFDPATGEKFPGYHIAENAGDPFMSASSIENPFIPNIFSVYTVPAIFTQPHVWPMSVFGAGGAGGGYIHIVSHEQRIDNVAPMEISYMRYTVDYTNGELVPATGNGDPLLITEDAMNISADVATSNDGSKVAVGVCVTRHETIGELWGTASESQVNNDVWVYLSDDYGETWDLNNPVDATQFAQNDTMRTYADCSVIFDDEDRLHVAYSAATGDALAGTSLVTSRVYHYMQDDDGNDWWTLIHYEPFAGYQPEAWGRTADRPCLYYDSDSGILWCLFRAFGGGEYDYGVNSGQGNGDLYVSASPPGMYNGLLWTQPVNITNTNWTTPGGAPVGECQSEMAPGMALDSDGPYLHISYLLDLDAGVAISSQPAGEITENPYVYHRVAKQELLDLFDLNGAWVQNFPMHVDEAGYWVDPGSWEWEEYGGFFTGNREPVPASLELTPGNTTIPPNGGVATYTIHFESLLPNTVPNVTYWTMITTPAGDLYGPLLQQMFTVTPYMDVSVPASVTFPGWAPGGFYEFHGNIGFYPNAVLHDSFNIWKLGDGPDSGAGAEEWGHSEVALDANSEPVQTARPVEYALSAARPNPFNPATSLTLSLPVAAEVRVTVHNIEGRQVAVLADGPHPAGRHELVFDGSRLASGLYFVHAEVPGEFKTVRKLTLLK